MGGLQGRKLLVTAGYEVVGQWLASRVDSARLVAPLMRWHTPWRCYGESRTRRLSADGCPPGPCQLCQPSGGPHRGRQDQQDHPIRTAARPDQRPARHRDHRRRPALPTRPRRLPRRTRCPPDPDRQCQPAQPCTPTSPACPGGPSPTPHATPTMDAAAARSTLSPLGSTSRMPPRPYRFTAADAASTSRNGSPPRPPTRSPTSASTRPGRHNSRAGSAVTGRSRKGPLGPRGDYDENRSQIHPGTVSQVMAALCNAAIGALRTAGITNIAAANPHHARDRTRPLGCGPALDHGCVRKHHDHQQVPPSFTDPALQQNHPKPQLTYPSTDYATALSVQPTPINFAEPLCFRISAGQSTSFDATPAAAGIPPVIKVPTVAERPL